MIERRADVLGSGRRFAVVVSRFNEFITRVMLDGCVGALKAHGVKDDDVTVTWVPGAFEIPIIAKRLAEKGGVHAVVCLGCIIRGETPHFDYVAAESARGIAQAALATNVPVVYGIITADNLEQAIERAGAKMGNKGADAALTALEMANLLKHLE